MKSPLSLPFRHSQYARASGVVQKHPTGSKLSKNLRGSSEEQALKAEKGEKAKASLQARVGGKKAASRARRNAQEDANAAANDQTEFNRDGAIVEDGEEAPRQGVAMG